MLLHGRQCLDMPDILRIVELHAHMPRTGMLSCMRDCQLGTLEISPWQCILRRDPSRKSQDFSDKAESFMFVGKGEQFWRQSMNVYLMAVGIGLRITFYSRYRPVP